MRAEEWADILPVIKSAFNNVPSPQRNSVSPITTLNGMEPRVSVNTSLRIEIAKKMTVEEVPCERAIIVDELTNFCPSYPLLCTMHGRETELESNK